MSFVKNNKKLFVFLLSVLILIVMVFTGIKIFQYYHPTYYKFNDRFVIGNSIENIEERYGPLDFVGYTSDGLKTMRYFAEEGSPAFFHISVFWHPAYTTWYYYIYFDENDIAQKVELKEFA